MLIHGWGMNSGVWGMALPLLQSDFAVRTLDLPGHGVNAQQAAAADMEDWADALIAQAPASAVWVGWSLGGMAALAAAQKAPQKIAALVLVASNPKFVTAPDWPHAIAPELLYQFENQLRSDHRQLLDDFIMLQSMGASKLREEARWLRKCLFEGGEPASAALSLGLQFLLHVDLRVALKQLQCPCLLVLGERDKLVPVQLAEVFRREYPQIDVAIIKGSGHAPFLSHAAEFVEITGNWIKEQPV